MIKKLEKNILKKKEEIQKELPVIGISIFLFLTLWYLFGSQNIILVAFITIYFKLRYKEPFKLKGVIKSYLIMLVLSIFSFLGNQNLILCILVNMLVPFFLVYMLTDKFTPRVYYIYGMSFTFMQLLAVAPEHFPKRVAGLTYSFFIVGIFMFFYDKYMGKNNLLIIQDKVNNIINVLEKHLTLKDYSREKVVLEKDIKELTQKIYSTRNYKYLATEYGKILYITMIFTEKILYFIKQNQKLKDEREILVLDFIEILKCFIENFEKNRFNYVKEKIKKYSLSVENDVELKKIVDAFLQVVEELIKKPKDKYVKEWKIPECSKKLDRVEKMFRLDLFHIRFAVRLSFVLTISFALTHFIPLQKSYWYPMSSFLMLMPYMEESREKINSRIFGTLGGIILVGVLMFLSGNILYRIMIIIVMIMLMYTAPVNSWIMVMYTTCYGLTLATISFKLEEALILRGVYVIIAVITVYLANKYIFPNTVENEFKITMKEIFEIERKLIIEVRKSLKNRIEINKFRELILKYNLLSIEVENYSQKKVSRIYYSKLMEITYDITIELEELKELIISKKVILLDDNYLNEILKSCEANIKKSYFSYIRKKELEWENLENIDFESITENRYFNMIVERLVKNVKILEELHKKYFE